MATTTPRPGHLVRGTLGQLARAERETASARGARAAALEAIRFEAVLTAFRAHLLATPPEVRRDSYDAVLTMIELMIWRERMCGGRGRPDPSPGQRRRLRGHPPHLYRLARIEPGETQSARRLRERQVPADPEVATPIAAGAMHDSAGGD